MVIDTLLNADKYYHLHPLLAKAFKYIRFQNLREIEAGRYEIANGLKAIVSDKEGMSREESIAKFECHNQNIDIQLCIRGIETIGWKPRSECKNPQGDYNEEKDVQFFSDAPDMYFQLKPAQFAIFFPEDVHAPMIADEAIKKMVIKVRL